MSCGAFLEVRPVRQRLGPVFGGYNDSNYRDIKNSSSRRVVPDGAPQRHLFVRIAGAIQHS